MIYCNVNDQLATPSLIDHIEAAIVGGLQQVDLPLKHVFTEGLYQRIIHMPAGTILTSRVHKKEHPFVVMQGCCIVINETDGTRELVKAPYSGITKAGTRRALLIITDTIWATFHVTDLKDHEQIIAEFTDEAVNPLIKKLQ